MISRPATVALALALLGQYAQAVGIFTTNRTTTVTIVGAGTAGIKAAQDLAAAGIDFIVVEAKDTVGGRVQDSEFGGYVVEDGANWIHGPLHKNPKKRNNRSNNPLWKYKKRYKMQGAYTDYKNWKFSYADGSEVPQATAEKWKDRIEKSLEHCHEKSDELWEDEEDITRDLGEEDLDISIAQCLRDFGYWNGTIDVNTGVGTVSERNETERNERDVARFSEWKRLDFEYAQRSSEISVMWAFPLNGKLEDEDFFVTDQRGYRVFLDKWANELENDFPDSILLNQIVTNITTTNKSATVVTKDGTTIVSDYVLCTLPLGVLQNEVVAFDPPFSEIRKDGINGMVMTNYAKLYLQFDTRFWGDEEIIITVGDIEKPNSFPWAINFDLPKYLPGSKILSFHVMGGTARAIESQPIDTTVAAALAVLHKDYGEEVVSNVVASKVTDWSTNPLAFGSYSDWPLNYTEAEHAAMTAPHKRVHFGGEHTTPDDYGYVHGAWKTGKKQAETLILLLHSCKHCKKAIRESPCNPKACRLTARKLGNNRLQKKCHKLCNDVAKKGRTLNRACKRHKFCK